MQIETHFKEIFNDAFNKVKKKFYQQTILEENENDIFPRTLAKKKLIDSLPPKMQIIEITGPNEHQSLKNGRGFLIKYDFDELNSTELEFCGTVAHTDTKKLVELINTKFSINSKGINNYVDGLCSEFNLIGYWDENSRWYMHFIPDDITLNPEILFEELERLFLIFGDIPHLSEKFKPEFYEDYNKIYGIASDPIRSFENIIQINSTSKAFSLDVAKLQRAVSNIQLIPKVPDDIRRAISMAKSLFIYGYFNYEFFTISQHYAYSALEGAIKIRYIKSFGNRVVLTDKKYKDLKVEFENPTYSRIERFCYETNPWNVKRLLINGEDFQHNTKKLIQWLVNKKIIRKWEKEFFENSIEMRNIYSHFEHVQITMPKSSIIQRNVEKINHLFHNV